jgi:SOS-response transcriptional repressor LexA
LKEKEGKTMPAPEKPTAKGSLGDKLRAWRKHFQLDAKTLARLADIDPSYLSQVEHGRFKQVGRDHLEKIAKALDITVEDLNRYPDAAPAGASPNPYYIPILGRIAAGQPVDIGNDPEAPILDFAKEHPASYALEVAGRSMLDRHIIDGDYILVDKEAVPEQGALVVAVNRTGTFDDGRATLKRYYKFADRVELHPANDEEAELYKPFVIPASEWAHDWLIQGTVKGLYRSYSSTRTPVK